MVKYLKPGENFGPSHFSKDFGFSGSCGGAVKMAHGGAPHIAHKPRRHALPGAPKINKRGKLEIDPAVAKGMLHKAAQVGALAGARAAAGAGAAPAAPPMAPPDLGAPGGPDAAPVPLPAAPGMKKGGHLTAKQRHAMPSSEFALPGKGTGLGGKGAGSYPIPDQAHARSALSRVSANGSPSEKAAVRAKVRSKFPGIGQKRD